MQRLFLITLFLLPVVLPSLALAFHTPEHKFFVPCGVDKNKDGVVKGPGEECTFTSVIDIANSIIIGWIYFTVVIATVGFAYAGYLYITAMGSEEKIKHAHSIFYKTALGFAFVLGAWLIAYTFEQTFLTEEAKQRSFLEGVGNVGAGNTGAP